MNFFKQLTSKPEEEKKAQSARAPIAAAQKKPTKKDQAKKENKPIDPAQIPVK